jgi:hypothetical protein
VSAGIGVRGSAMGSAGGMRAGEQWPIAACSGGHAGSAAGGVAAGMAMPGIDVDCIGIGAADTGGIEQWLIAACSGEHIGRAGSAGLGAMAHCGMLG